MALFLSLPPNTWEILGAGDLGIRGFGCKMAACVRSSLFCRKWNILPSVSGCSRLEKRFLSIEENVHKDTNDQDDESKLWLKKVKPLPGKPFIPLNYRYLYPEFLPDKDPSMRHKTREILERNDMLKRRRVIDIPEFYVGSILAVTASDRFAPGKINRFVGICIQRIGYGMRAKFVLRNIVEHQGMEIAYDLYNPTLRKIEVLKLEKRLDKELFYLRDAYPEYSTFPFDMKPVPHLEGTPVPINPIKVKLKPLPWYAKWEQHDLKGVEDYMDMVPLPLKEKAVLAAKPWEKWDLMKEYRESIPEEEQQELYQDVYLEEQRKSKTNPINGEKSSSRNK